MAESGRPVRGRARCDTLDQHGWRYREGLDEQIAETRDVIARLRRDLQAGR